MLSTRDRRCDRHSLLDVAEFLATRLKQMPMHGTAVDMRVREGPVASDAPGSQMVDPGSQ